MTSAHKLTAFAAIVGILAWGALETRAAKAPASPEELNKGSSHIVSGKVVEVTSKTQKSKVEKARGIHRDRVFTIKLKVETVSKGDGIKAGDEIEIIAWKPAQRIPRLPGLQGHESIPKKGDVVTVYLVGKKADAYEPILPNGIAIDSEAE